jgi:hypothetical protein
MENLIEHQQQLINTLEVVIDKELLREKATMLKRARIEAYAVMTTLVYIRDSLGTP